MIRTMMIVLLGLGTLAHGQTLAGPGDDLGAKLAEAEGATGMLVLQKGIYWLSRPLVVNSSVSITGASREAVLILPGPNFSGDAMIEVIATPGRSLRGINVSRLTLACTLGISPSSVMSGVLLGRNGNGCESHSHQLDEVYVVGRFRYGFVLLGAETSALRDCQAILTAPGAVGLYASHANSIEIHSQRLGGLAPAGGTTSYNRIEGGAFGAGPNGYSVRFDGSVSAWTLTNTFFIMAAGDGNAAVIRLHGQGTFASADVPYQLRLIGCGNDVLRTRYGIEVTSERSDGYGAGGLTLLGCQLLAREAPLRCTHPEALRKSQAFNCMWLRAYESVPVDGAGLPVERE